MEALQSVRNHVNPDPPTECIKELARLIRNRDFGWEFGSHLFTVLAWICAWAAGLIIDKAVFGASGDRTELYSALCDLHEALGCDPLAFDGPITDAIINNLLSSVIAALIDFMEQEGFTWLIDMLKDLVGR